MTKRKYYFLTLFFILVLSVTMGMTMLIPEKASAVAIETENKTLSGTLKKIEQLYSFEDESELNGVEIISNAARKEIVKKIANTPGKSSEGKKCLQLFRSLVPCTETMKIKLGFGKKDLTDMPVFSFAVNSYGGQPEATLYYVKSTAISGSGEEYSKTYGYVADTWNAVSFDLSECPFVSDVCAVTLEFFTNSTSSLSWEGGIQIDNVFLGQMIDFRFMKDGNTQGFTAEGADLTVENDMMTATATSSTVKLDSPVLKYTAVLSTLYASSAEMKNAIYTVIENNSSATEMQIRYKTSAEAAYTDVDSKSIAIDKNAKKLYVINFSDKSSWNGDVCGFEYVFKGVKAGETISIDSIYFHEDEVIYPYAESGKVKSVVANAGLKTMSVKGSFSSRYRKNFLNAKIALFADYCSSSMQRTLNGTPIATMKMSDLSAFNGTCDFDFENISFIKSGNKNYFDHYFTVAIIDSGFSVAVDKPRSIDNIFDFVDKKYYFENPTATIKVRDVGAKGDGFTDDTDAIQYAVDAISEAGGGRVLLDDNRTYIATNIKLRGNVTFEIQEGSVLRQSEDFRDYKYDYELGHNSTNLSYINWAHCNLVSNYPILQANNVKNIKITGKGKIVMSDADNYGDDLINSGDPLEYQYSVCSHRLHSMPIGFSDCENVEISNFEVAKSSGYHLTVVFSSRVTVYGVELNRVKCVSSDGINVRGTDGVVICGMYLNGNDDGIVIWSVYEDPRELWFFNEQGKNQAPRNIDIYGCYISSGGGKAIALLPWGSSDPNPENEEIRNIIVKNCSLSGGYSVGVWPDNPYNGKQPYDNSELDDWSHITDLTVVDCDYLSPVNVYPLTITGLVSDCGLVGAEDFMNAEFDEGILYWSLTGNAEVVTVNGDKIGRINGKGCINEGLYLKAGEYLFKANIKAQGGDVKFFVKNAFDGVDIISKEIAEGDWRYAYLFCVINDDGTYRIGIESENGSVGCIDSVSVTKTLNNADNTLANSEIYSTFEEMPKDLEANSSSWKIADENGNKILTQDNAYTLNNVKTNYADYAELKATFKMKLLAFAGADNMATITLRGSDKASYIIYFSRARGQIAIRKDKKGEQLLATTSFDMNLGEWYDISVKSETIGKNVKITLTINGEEVLSGSDYSSVIKKGYFAIGCYNTSVSIDDLYVTETIAYGYVKEISVTDENGKLVDGADIAVYSNGKKCGDYVSVNGKFSVTLDAESDDVYYTAVCLGYEKISNPQKLGANNTIVLTSRNKIIADGYDDSVYWNFGDSYEVAEGELKQTDGANNLQEARLKVNGFTDFICETNLIYTGGNAGPGNGVSLWIYKGSDKIRLEYQPYYGLVGLHKYNFGDGNDYYDNYNGDAVKGVGTELRIVYGTKNHNLFVKVYCGKNLILDGNYDYVCKDDSTVLALSSYGLTFKSSYFILNAENAEYESNKYTAVFLDENGNVISYQRVSSAAEIIAPDAGNIANFVKWNRDISTVDKTAVISPVTSESSYTLTFKNENGDVLSSQTIVGGKGIINVPAVKLGANGNFVGWEDESGNMTDVYAVRTDKVLTAVIKNVKHRVTFIDGNGTKYVTYAEHGKDIVVPEIPSIAGYAFKKYNIPFDKAYNDMVILLEYTPKKVKVTYADENGRTIFETEIDYGSNASAVEMPEKDGYEFVGFDKTLSCIKSDTVFTAVYKSASYDVVFFDFYGNIIQVSEVERGKGAVAPTLSSDGINVFKGWKQDFTNISGYLEVYPVTEDDENRVEVIFVNTLTGESETKELGKTDNTVEDPVYEGYVFDGWYYDESYTRRVDFKNDTLSGRVYVYSKWSKAVQPDKEPDKKHGCSGSIGLISMISILQMLLATLYVVKKK